MTDFRWGAATDVGRVRRANQDRHLVHDGLFHAWEAQRVDRRS